jgi:hypothetical protein
VLGKPASALNAKKPVKYESQIHLTRPTVALVKSQRYAVAPVDLGEKPNIKIIQNVAAEHTRVLHCRVQKTLPGPAPAYDKINPTQIEKKSRHQSRVYIRELRLSTSLRHSSVDNLVPTTLQRRENVSVAICRTRLVNHRDSHF